MKLQLQLCSILHRLFALALFLVVPLSAHAALEVGSPAPSFSIQASLGGNVSDFFLDEALKKGPVVLYFYPAAFTKGCTIEAHDFAEAVDEYKQYGATVLGVSADNIEKLKEFSVSECRSKFAVAADPNTAVIKAYDAQMAFKPNMANRISYVITPDHKIYYEYSSMDPDDHVKNTMAAVKKWAQEHAKTE